MLRSVTGKEECMSFSQSPIELHSSYN